MNYQTYTDTVPPAPIPKTSGAFNNAFAQAQSSADPRFNMKQYDRAGISRGKGTAAQANIQGQQALADGLAQAYQIPMQDAVANANNTLNYDQMRETYGQQLSGLAQQNDYANAMAALQRQQNGMNFQSNILGGLLGDVGGMLGGLWKTGSGGGWLNSILG